MTEARDVTIKAHELDWLLQLALAGNQVRPLKTRRAFSESPDRLQDPNRLQGLNRLQDRDETANTAGLSSGLDSSLTACPQTPAVAVEDLPPRE